MNNTEFPRIVMLNVTGLNDFPKDFQVNYHTHLLCQKGHISFLFNDVKMTCKRNEFVFWFANSRLTDLQVSKDFKAIVLLVENNFLYDNVPDQNFSIDAVLHSKRYPLRDLRDKVKRQRVLKNFEALNARFQDKKHRFYEEVLKLQMRLFIFEMWDISADEYERRKRSLQTGTLFERFMSLVQEHCMQEREVQFYADRLHITAKYLNAVSKQNSGITASDWIQRFTKERIELLLQNENLSIAQIADEMNFSSYSYFTRYVKKVLGVTPSKYRNRN
ncbi:MAG: AraC family transcriptional regulator [Thermoflavifilum aggregans]|nr:AraC family transcriptional regulator [Thermoflavifilum aggregans]